MAQKKTKSWQESMNDIIESFGIRLPRAGNGVQEQKVRVVGPTSWSDEEWIGTLWMEDGLWCFEYSVKYANQKRAVPLSAFPDLDERYQDKQLWPFFSVRLPSKERGDVRKVMDAQKIRPDETLRVLGLVCSNAIASPYKFQLVSAQP